MLDVVVDPDDVWVVHSGQQPGLCFEAGLGAFVGRGEDLDRYLAVQAAVPASEHQAEVSGAEFGTQLVDG